MRDRHAQAFAANLAREGDRAGKKFYYNATDSGNSRPMVSEGRHSMRSNQTPRWNYGRRHRGPLDHIPGGVLASKIFQLATNSGDPSRLATLSSLRTTRAHIIGWACYYRCRSYGSALSIHLGVILAIRMVSVKPTILVALYVLTCTAVKITVSPSGGNATSGHQYGFLHEVMADHILEARGKR